MNELSLIYHPSRLVRTTDPDTSHAAAKSASVRGPSQRTLVWQAMKELNEATDYELATHLGILRSSAAKRRQELTELGLIEPTNKRRETDSGSAAIVWRRALPSVSECPF